MDLKNITFPAFIWYVMPGINFFILLIVFPLSVLNYGIFIDNLSAISGFTVIFGVTAGFLLSSLKIYHLSRFYAKEKNNFYNSLAKVCSSTDNHPKGEDVFNNLVFVMRKEKIDYPIWDHSNWVMILLNSITSLFAAFEWMAILYFKWQISISLLGVIQLNNFQSRALLIFFVLLFLLLSKRLNQVYRKSLINSNKTYLKYLLQYQQSVMLLTIEEHSVR